MFKDNWNHAMENHMQSANKSLLTGALKIDDVCSGHPLAVAELKALRQITFQANERLTIVRHSMRKKDWKRLCQECPDANDWFDVDGITVYRT